MYVEAPLILRQGGLSRTKEAADKDAEEVNGLEEGETEQPAAGPARRKTKTAANTLETNLHNLNLRNLDLEFHVDPLFRKTSSSFDDHGGRGLLLSHLNVYNGIIG